MATTVFAYNLGKVDILNSGAALLADTLKISLHTSTYSPNIDTDEFHDDAVNELSASGNYTVGGETLATRTVTIDTGNDRAVFDADDLTWTALTPSAAFRYGVCYDDTGTENTSQLWFYMDFGADQNPGGSDFTIQFHADGILYI